MLNAIKRAVAAVREFTRDREPVAMVSGSAATVTALVAEWQGDLTGDAAWLAVLWGVATWLARRYAWSRASVDREVEAAMRRPLPPGR